MTLPGLTVVLASASKPRARMFEAAGIAFSIDPAAIDEPTVKASIRGQGGSAEDAAEALATMKAQQVAARHGDALVIGADQVLECEGEWFDKPVDAEAARRQLVALRGRTHELVTAVAAVRGHDVLWHHVDRARLAVRPFSDHFLDDYVDRAGEAAWQAVGGYELEGLGVQLFTRVEGNHFSILGLPLLPLLEFLRGHGVIVE